MMKYFNMITPLVVIAICFLKNYTIYALHLGTVVGLLMQSRFTLFCQIQYKKEIDLKSISFLLNQPHLYQILCIFYSIPSSAF
ncbi:hypothetical protein CBF65_02540 [Lactobacillus johnsonii]|nr:hypothetical protein CBF65_02540 [Lactobacillus johnsonii]